MKRIIIILMAFLSLSISPTFLNAQSRHKVNKVQERDVTVYITRTGAKYHSSGCSYLRRSSIAIGKRDAISQGYTACSRCF